MTPAQREAALRELDTLRRRAEAACATFVARADAVRGHRTDGHRTSAAMGRAACNWSAVESSRIARLGKVMRLLPSFEAAAVAGHIGVAQMHALASLASNPRVRRHLLESEELLVHHARTLHHDDFVTLLRQWESLADADGAHDRHERAHDQRRANLTLVGERCYLDAAGGLVQGTQLREIFDRFCEAEFRADWDAGAAVHGDRMSPGLMERTADQRRFDALHQLFRAAAGSAECGGDVVVNILIDQEQFEHHLSRALGATPPPLDPRGAAQRHCETDRGEVLDPAEVVVAACVGHVRRVVLDSTGVVLDMGRRSRLFTGPLREAVLLSGRRCLWPGCDRPARHCQADHVVPFAHDGPTAIGNGAPICAHHNRWKNAGYRTWRDDEGIWHTYRPDGSEIGWIVRRISLAELSAA